MFACVLLTVLMLITTISAQTHHGNHFCANFHPQMLVNFDQILGRWYATEVIFHDKEEIERIRYHNVCPIVHLSDVTTPMEEYLENSRNHQQNTHNYDELEELMKPLTRLWHETNINSTKRRWTPNVENEEYSKFKTQSLQNLRIVWNEQGTRNEYSLKYNVSKPGYWMSFGPQNASLQEKHHFIGTVQVLRAVRTHMVLTFCHITYRDQFFSVVLTREPWMETRELHNIHNFLQRKLPIKHVRRMCMDFVQNGTNKIQINAIITFLSVCLYFINKFS